MCMIRHRAALLVLVPVLVTGFVAGSFAPAAARQAPAKIFISVDMEGIGGIGTGQMTSSGGKDYSTGRRLMTDEVNAVVSAIFSVGEAEIVVNDSHGDMQNLLHTELDPRVAYIQGAIKPNGMMEGLDESFDGVIFLGYHARAGTEAGFLAHTGSGAVKGLWINGLEAGEGEMNALYAGALGIPVILASGDSIFVTQFSETVTAESVITKTAVTPQSARLRHPELVREELADATGRALAAIGRGEAAGGRAEAVGQPAEVVDPGAPVEVRLRFADPTRPQILRAMPGVQQVDGYTVEFTAPTMGEAYRLIRLMYRFVSI